MAVTRFLVDSSATARIRKPSVRARLVPLAEQGLLHTCDLLDLEAGFTAKSIEDYEQIMLDRHELYIPVPMPEDAFVRAIQLQQKLVRIGQHRGISIPDMLIAATANAHNLTVLHYDHDFELMAYTASCRHEWVVERGTAD